MPQYKDKKDMAEASKKKKTVRQSIKDIFVSKSGTKTSERDDDSSRKSNNKVPKGKKNSKRDDLSRIICSKCKPNKKKEIFLCHKNLNLEIIAPDVSNVCSCKTNCLHDRFNMNNFEVCIERVEMDNKLPWLDNESEELQPEISCGGIIKSSRSDTESPKNTGTYCVQRVELDNTLTMSQKESDILLPSSNGGSSGTGTEMPIPKKSSKLSKIGSIISQKGSAISRKISKISHRSTKMTDPDDIQSEFSVFLDTILPDSKFKTPPFKELKDKSAKNPQLSIFDEYDETKSADTSDSKALK